MIRFAALCGVAPKIARALGNVSILARRATSVDAGAVTLENKAHGRLYTCELTDDNNTDAYDCKRTPFEGETGRVAALGLMVRHCTGGNIGSIAVTIDGVSPGRGNASCTYNCDI